MYVYVCVCVCVCVCEYECGEGVKHAKYAIVCHMYANHKFYITVQTYPSTKIQ